MSKRNHLLLIQDMLLACRRIRSYTGQLDYAGFITDEKTIDATVRNIQILGEAAKQVAKEVQERYPAIEWTKIIRSRHIIVHDYFELDYEIIWRIIQDYIPPLQAELERIVGAPNR
jgi:uncharacterized protein with HEPN domain